MSLTGNFGLMSLQRLVIGPDATLDFSTGSDRCTANRRSDSLFDSQQKPPVFKTRQQNLSPLVPLPPFLLKVARLRRNQKPNWRWFCASRLKRHVVSLSPLRAKLASSQQHPLCCLIGDRCAGSTGRCRNESTVSCGTHTNYFRKINMTLVSPKGKHIIFSSCHLSFPRVHPVL